MSAAGRQDPHRRPVIETNVVEKVKHPDGTKTINGFHVLSELGSGSFAEVKLCEEESSAERFALKVFRKGKLRRQRDFIGQEGGGMKIRTSLDKVYGEIQLSKRISHRNCICLHAVFDDPEKDGKLYLVLELASLGATMEWDPDACSYLAPATGGVLPEAQARHNVREVLSGLNYLHEEMIAHRDIKPQNLLVHEDGRVKIADFGVAIEMGEGGLVQGSEGTYYFYSSEMCCPGYTVHDGRKADVWALGVTTFAFLFGKIPFFTMDLASLFDTIAAGVYTLPESPDVSDQARSFLDRLLMRSPDERPLAAELAVDPWCNAGMSLGPAAAPA